MSNKARSALWLILILPVALLSVSEAKPRSSVKYTMMRQENPAGKKEHLILPYAFATESMGITLGIGGGAKGYGQDQLLVGGTCWRSVDDAAGIVLGMWDYRLPETSRVYFTLLGSLGYYPRQRAYSFPYFEPGATRPGSNDSEEDDYVELSGNDNWLDLTMEIVLPMGAARHESAPAFRVANGMRVSAPLGGTHWNPLTSGVTNLLLRQYNRYQSFETGAGAVARTMHPVELALYHNNTDFPPNPCFGSTQYLSVSHDFGWWESNQTWTFIEFEAAKYVSLGTTDRARQRVAAFNFWTGETLSWKESLDADDRIEVLHRPPHYEGARLGGMYRLRAYPSNRFNSRAVIYSSLEYRYTPKWNPLGGIAWLRSLRIDWWQFVGFIEGGRVAESYGFSELMQDWKVDGGVGVRAFMAGAVVRLDFAVSDESSSIWLMLGHPF